MDAQGCRVLLLVPRIKAGVDGRGCVTGACDRTRSWSEFAKGCMTGLGTRGCQGVRLDLELERVCQVVRSLKAEDRRFNSRRLEFECRRLDLVSIGSEFLSV